MARAGQDIHGQDGFKLHLLRTAAETDDELLEMEASWGGTGNMPPEHFHPNQVERFEVLEGELRAIVDGEERTYAVGDTFEVPTGTPHQMTADSPARARWEVRPALRTAEFFERLYAALDAGDAAKVAEVVAEFSDEVRFTAA